MASIRLRNLGETRTTGNTPNPETAFFMAAFTFAFAMLSVFAVLAIAGLVEVVQILPFVALPLGLFAASALFVRRWLTGDVESAAVHEAVRWRAVVDGSPRIARERFGWARDDEESAVTQAMARPGPVSGSDRADEAQGPPTAL